jgi:hypothetical protein
MESITSLTSSQIHSLFNNSNYFAAVEAIWKEEYGKIISYFGNIVGSKSILLVTDRKVVFLNWMQVFEFDLNNMSVELVKNNFIKGIFSSRYQIKIQSNSPTSTGSKAEYVQFAIGKVIILNGAHTVNYQEAATKALYEYMKNIINIFKKGEQDFICFSTLTFDSKKGAKDYIDIWCIEKLFIFDNHLCIVNDKVFELNKKDIKNIEYEQVSYLGKKFKVISITDFMGSKVSFGSYNAGTLDNRETAVMFKTLEKWRSVF